LPEFSSSAYLTDTQLSRLKRIPVYYVLHCTPDRPYPLHSGAPFPTLERARLECRKLVKQGYSGWILRLREVRQEAWPKDQWLIDHSVEDAIGWMEQF
jgi:hypothetical protein